MEERVEKVSDYLVEGEEVDVKVIGIDDRGRVKLSIKAVNSPEETTEGSIWWLWVDLNYRPLRYECSALTS